MLFESAAGALKWIADTLLKKHQESLKDKRERWDRVADYLDKVAGLVDGAAADFRAMRIPHGHYSQMVSLASDFGDVISQVFDKDSSLLSFEYAEAFSAAVHLVEEGDAMVLEARDLPQTKDGRAVLADLEAAAGKFRAIAMTIRAQSSQRV
jgi:hypothetical protein